MWFVNYDKKYLNHKKNQQGTSQREMINFKADLAPTALHTLFASVF